MDVNVKDLAARMIGMLVVFGLALFLPAGTISWVPGWVFLILFFSFTLAVTLWLYRHDPALLKERMTGFTADQKTWDKFFLILMNVLFMAWLVLMPLDAARFRWSQMPFWLQGVGAAALLCSFYLFFLTFRENPFLSPVVRVQEERGQTVISTGPYRFVRHPMYSATILFFLGTAFLLGSWYGVLVGGILVALIGIRAVMEERALREELDGYKAHMERVRYRFVPYVW